MVYWNPAGTTGLPGWSFLAGAASIAIDGGFNQDTTGRSYKADVPTAFVPHFFVNHMSANSKMALGFGVYVPYGLTSQWQQDFPGRFIAQKASLKTIYFQPNIGWKLSDRWSIGGGPVIAYSSVELNQGVDLSQFAIPGLGTTTFSALGIAPRTEFARAKLEGNGTGFGVHIGTMGKITDHLTLGARFLSSIVISYDDADASFSQVNTNLIIGGAVPNPANPAGAPAIPAGAPVEASVDSSRGAACLSPRKPRRASRIPRRWKRA